MKSSNLKFCALFFVCVFAQALALKCVVNEAEPIDDPNNVYSCQADESCCKDSQGPSCCKTPAVTAAMSKQVKIWGGILFLVAAVVFIICCCRKSYLCCCESDGKSSGCCSCCKRKPKNAERLP